MVGNNNQDARTILQLAKTAALRLAKCFEWSALTYEAEFFLVKDQPSYELESDFDRFINGTMWDRVESRPVGAVSPQVWQEYKSGLISSVIYKRWRIKANAGAKEIFIDPTPNTSQCVYECRDGTKTKLGVAYEYISNNLAATSAGAGIKTFAADTDTFLLPDDLLELSLKWRWLNSLSQSYTEEKDEFERALIIAKSQDSGAPTIQMDGEQNLPYPNIPESGVGL